MLELEAVDYVVNYALAPWVLPAVIGASALAGLWSSSKANKTAQAGQAASARQSAQQLQFQREQAAILEQQKARYREFEFKNPYADIKNQFEGMQNVYEDLTVDQEAARFQMEQGAQQRATILSGMRGAAGGSGIAGLAQALAGQGTLQARQVSADISQQEAQNRRLAAQGAMQVEQMRRQGASAADMARRGGEQMIQEAEMQRQSTLLGVAYGGMQGANAGVQQAYANQMQSNMAMSQMQMQQAGMWMNLGSTAVTALST